MAIDHVGIATTDSDQFVEMLQTLIETTVVHEEVFDGLAITFLESGNGTLEVLEPLEDGPIATYLDTHGPGMHHLAFETDDIHETIDRAREVTIRVIDEPRPGARGHTVAFLHPKDTGGVLIEFVEH